MIRTRRKGFTLIELLVVIAIIGILSAIGLAQINGGRERARNAKRVADIRQIQTVLELYYADYNEYPHVDCGNPNVTVDQSWTALQQKLDPYTGVLPNDPLVSEATSIGNHTHKYTLLVSGVADKYQHYVLLAGMEAGGWSSFKSLPNVIPTWIGVKQQVPDNTVEDMTQWNSSAEAEQFTWCGKAGYLIHPVHCGEWISGTQSYEGGDYYNGGERLLLYTLCVGKPQTQGCTAVDPRYPNNCIP